ncbi:glycine cleavage system aminomethyltransferase GcvT [Candidatus Thorarchaeota archaeon]|nr:MAG: glycine cleavage system aminomethyltransferase GcvT [Candidatus Thorarchaeota archaeon]
MDLERTQLYEWHKKHGHVVPFSGWEMPVRYSDIVEEHMAVRDAIGIFDTSHMARFFIKGEQAAEFLQRISTNNVSKLGVNDGQYSTCLNGSGGTRDDLTLYRIDENEFVWVTNAVNGPKIREHMLKHARDYDVQVNERTKEVTMIAVQGPKAMGLLSEMAGRNLGEYKRFTCNKVQFGNHDTLLCRTGYTGEDGAEILVLDTPLTDEGKQRAVTFWETLLQEGASFGIKPCGLGARDSARLEAGFVLYGNELDEETSPIEARIPYAVKFKVEPHYLGYDEVRRQKKEGVRKTRIGLVMIERGIPRGQYPIRLDGKEIGKVTSGMPSPILKRGIAMGYVKPNLVEAGDTVEVDIKGRKRRAEIVNWPFYDPDVYGATRKS